MVKGAEWKSFEKTTGRQWSNMQAEICFDILFDVSFGLLYLRKWTFSRPPLFLALTMMMSTRWRDDGKIKKQSKRMNSAELRA